MTTHITNDNLPGLPKWPQMIVSGHPVTVEQAKDIVLKTDPFLTHSCEDYGGNNREFNAAYRKKASLVDPQNPDIELSWEENEEIRKEIGVIYTDYVYNDWASCAYIGGPHGWCSPEGVIYYDDNIGKWPSAEEVLDEWKRIAEAFPYLDIYVTIMDGECCEDDTSPLFNIRVVGGNATVEDADLSAHSQFSEKMFNQSKLDRDAVFKNKLLETFLCDSSGELGLPADWYDEFAEKVAKAAAHVRSNRKAEENQ